MVTITKRLTFQMKRIATFIVLEGENREFYWFALILTLFVIIGDSKLLHEAVRSANKIFAMYLDYRDDKDFIGMDMCRKFLEMGFTRARRYANHNSGRKYKKGTKEILPQEEDHMTSKYAESARIFKHVRDIVAKSDDYVRMRKQWRASE